MHHRTIVEICMEWAMAQNDSAPPDPWLHITMKCGNSFHGRFRLGDHPTEGVLTLETTSNHQVAENLRYGIAMVELSEIACVAVIPYGDPLYGARDG